MKLEKAIEKAYKLRYKILFGLEGCYAGKIDVYEGWVTLSISPMNENRNAINGVVLSELPKISESVKYSVVVEKGVAVLKVRFYYG